MSEKGEEQSMNRDCVQFVWVTITQLNNVIQQENVRSVDKNIILHFILKPSLVNQKLEVPTEEEEDDEEVEEVVVEMETQI